ncbi:MAG: hypothetical protein HKN47_28205 [Pirellulaceae bacterium]|nr:hypothetical protein [Pirellulaceae bacterium]
MPKSRLKRNDWVIYRKQKTSTSPGPRASDVHPAGKGDTYHYMVNKFWVVEEVMENDVKLCTRRGKRNVVPIADPALRPASWWERFVFRSRFTDVDLDTPPHDDDMPHVDKLEHSR